MCKTAYPEWWPMKRAGREEKGKGRKRKRKKERRECWRDSEKGKPQNRRMDKEKERDVPTGRKCRQRS
jgi:hypothetical protein